MANAPLSTERFRLWPETPPGGPPAANRKGTAEPTVSVYRPPRPDGRGVVVFPGGGYVFVSQVGEGANIARALAPFGITTFVVDYRLPVDGWNRRYDVPLQDAQRAIRLVRRHADRYRIDPKKLGIMGFSAGGHLGSVAVTAYDDEVYKPVDFADTLSARPAFGGLFYPVTTLTVVPPRSQSRRNLLGPDPAPSLITRYSAVERVTVRTPPLFLCHAMDDPIVPYWMSTGLAKAARARGVAVEMHLLETGGHGFGASLPPDLTGSRWPEMFALWTKRHTR
ncbi:alpha/beta hydrolase [Stakelama marina]|uniref:Alpha/beta hydrolase n=1 Tax=Stakelama marina TaxID=2826939 RepID=A0A8T4IFT6_9SPHN|nr:alpha/beta hydrolase [Stakelama marina]MBR0551925.1 alpha/beta hydrolase [Stakelama marina]